MFNIVRNPLVMLSVTFSAMLILFVVLVIEFLVIVSAPNALFRPRAEAEAHARK